jgi:hypothetical protein
MTLVHLREQIVRHEQCSFIAEACFGREPVDEEGFNTNSPVDVAESFSKLVQAYHQCSGIITDHCSSSGNGSPEPQSTLKIAACPQGSMRSKQREGVVATRMSIQVVIDTGALNEIAGTSSQSSRFRP